MRKAARWRRVATRMWWSASMSSPLRVSSSFASMRSKWKRRIFRPASAIGSSARTPSAFFFFLGLGVGACPSRMASARSHLEAETGRRRVPAELRVDGVKILERSRWPQLDLELAGERLVPGDLGVHGVERELAHRPLALFHGAIDPELAEGEELDERPPLAESLHDIAGGTLRPVRGSRVRGHGTFVLFALVHGPLRLAETLHGQEPTAV